MKKGTSKGAQQFKSEQRRIDNTFDEAYIGYMYGLKIKGCSEETLRSYENHKKYLLDF